MAVSELLRDLHQATNDRIYIQRLEILDQSATLIKVRLHISPGLFVQIYRNERFNTTNMVLIYNRRRLYARDQLNGVWHRHTQDAPHIHDTSPAGQQPPSLPQFSNEVEAVLAAMDLP